MNLRNVVTAAALCAAAAAALPHAARAQSAVLFRAQAGAVLGDRFRVDSSGAFVAYGFVRDVGNTTGCAAQLPASGAGTRFEWHPCRGSLRFGRVPTAQVNWDDNHMDDFTFAGGNQVEASGYGAFAYGDQVTVTSTVGVGFGSAVSVTGTAGFSSGASNVCSGFACTAIGYTVHAGPGQGTIALGYRTTATGDNSVSIGYRGSNNGHVGSIVLAGVVNPSTQTDSVRAQADGEFRLRAPGGIVLRTSFASNSSAGVGGNTGCDLPAGSGTFSCSSSRTIKENFLAVNGEDLLARIRATPVTSWNYIAEGRQVRHLGPVAEDFHAAFGLGPSANAVGLGDIDGVNFAGVKALEARTVDLQRQLDRRTAEAGELRGQVTGLEGQVAELRAQVQALLQRDAAAKP